MLRSQLMIIVYFDPVVKLSAEREESMFIWKKIFFLKQPSLVGIPTWSRALWLTWWFEIEWWTAEEDLSGTFQCSDCAIGESFFNDLLRKFQCSEEFAQWHSNQASAAKFKSEEVDCESFFCNSARQVVVFLSLRFMPVCHARFHWTSKFADNDVFGGYVDENDFGFELWIETSQCL